MTSSIDAGSQTLGPNATPATGTLAGFGKRLGAYLIDTIILAVPYGILSSVFPDAAVVLYFVYLLATLAYFAILEGGESGQTVGKMALGIRVRDHDTGGAIGVGRGLLRYVGRIPSGLVLLLGYFWMLWDNENQTWHDKIAKTVVVDG